MKVNQNNYTKNERVLLGILPSGGVKVSTTELTKTWRQATRKRIRFPQNSVSGAMRNLIKKVARNHEDFRIKRTRQMGPHAVEYWVEKR